MMNTSVAFRLLAVIAISFGLVGNASAMKQAKKCRANFEAINAKNNKQSFNLEYFKAEGWCGLSVPNRCRKRAVEKAHRCMKDHWAARHKGKRPDTCTIPSGVFGYELEELPKKIIAEACKLGWADKGSAVLIIRGNTASETFDKVKACEKTSVFSSTYVVKSETCAKLKKKYRDPGT